MHNIFLLFLIIIIIVLYDLGCFRPHTFFPHLAYSYSTATWILPDASCDFNSSYHCVSIGFNLKGISQCCDFMCHWFRVCLWSN